MGVVRLSMKWSSSLRAGSQSSPEVFGIENRFGLFLLVVACVALCHAVIVLFFNWDISFKNKSQLPDLEIELVSEAQVLGNADSTLVAKAHSGEKSKSKNSTQPVLSGRHSESSMEIGRAHV